NPLSIIISTQASTDADLLSILIDDAMAGSDPRTVVKLYTAPTDLDPFDEATIRLANPAFGTFLNAREVMGMAADAKRMPAREVEFRNLILNQRIEATNSFVSPAVWKACSHSTVLWSTAVSISARSPILRRSCWSAGVTANGMCIRPSGCRERGCAS